MRDIEAGSIVVLTGAGISAESGIRTFRASDGLWEDHRVEDVASPAGFARNPALVHRFYNARRAQLAAVEPNAAHLALARLQREWPDNVTIVTQNVDDLHERAGSQVIHMHGELLRVRCTACGAHHAWQGDTSPASACPACGEHALRPDIVWFGEMPYDMDEIQQALADAALFVAVGTSGLVYPAAGFIDIAKGFGAKTLEINLEHTAASARFDRGEYGAATNAVSRWVQAMLA